MTDSKLNISKEKLAELGATWIKSGKSEVMDTLIERFGKDDALILEFLADIMKTNRPKRNFLDEYNDIAHDSEELYLGFTVSRKARIGIAQLIVNKL